MGGLKTPPSLMAVRKASTVAWTEAGSEPEAEKTVGPAAAKPARVQSANVEIDIVRFIESLSSKVVNRTGLVRPGRPFRARRVGPFKNGRRETCLRVADTCLCHARGVPLRGHVIFWNPAQARGGWGVRYNRPKPRPGLVHGSERRRRERVLGWIGFGVTGRPLTEWNCPKSDMAIDLTGKPIAITGASSGIGLATAKLCAGAGMPVVLAARRADRLEAAAAEIRRAGGKAIAVACDVADEADCRRVVTRTVEEFGSVYSVFANAGYGFEGPIHESTEYDLRAIFETNFWGSLHLARAALEHMIPAKAGHVLFCSSCVSKIGIPNFAAYSATKAAQDHFARGMRHELAGLGIHVSSVHPVQTKTEFFDVAAEKSERPSMVSRPPLFMYQPAERVGKAIVRCLRKPRGEVWTSFPVRLGLGLSVIVPGLTDWALGRIDPHGTK